MEHTGDLLAYAGEGVFFGVMDCETCGFAHLDPLPDPGLLAEKYRSDYFETDKAKVFERQLEDRDWWDNLHNGRLRDLAELVEPDLLKARRPIREENRTLLEIGAGSGHFTDAASHHGWKCSAIEPSNQGFERLKALQEQELHRGLLVYQGMFPEVLKASGINDSSFDVIYANEVLEHVADAGDFVNSVFQLLKPGGLFAVQVPNDFNRLQRLVTTGEIKKYWIHHTHVNYFTSESFDAFLSHGFEAEVAQNTFPMEIFQLMGLHYPGNDEIGRQVHGYRMLFDLAIDLDRKLKRDFYHAMTEIGLGRDLYRVVRKKS